jgi:hypothetical protein
MNFFKSIFQSPSEACLSIYKKAKEKQPNKSEADYLKIILLAKPPFDYQLDSVINIILRENENINDLAEFIEDMYKDEGLWLNRKRNLEIYKEKLEKRNQEFFKEFWS